jgi:hypothetical protein
MSKTIKSVSENVLEMHRSLRVEVKIPHDEVDRLVVNRLISIRNSVCNRKKDMTYIDETIKFFLTEEEFIKYAVEKNEIEY